MTSSSTLNPFDYETIGHTVFAIGRFLCALAGYLIKPRYVLLFLFLGLIVSSTLAMDLTGSAGVSMVILILLFEVRSINLSIPLTIWLTVPVWHIPYDLCHLTPRTRQALENRSRLPHCRNIGRGRLSRRHESRRGSSRITLLVLCGGGNLRLWSTFSSLPDGGASSQEASRSGAQEPPSFFRTSDD